MSGARVSAAYLRSLEVPTAADGAASGAAMTVTNHQQAPVLYLPIDAISVGANVRRGPANPGADAGLVASIASQGVLQAITVRPHPDDAGRYELVFGERRLRCAKGAGLDTIPAQVRRMTDAEMIAAGGAENLQREPMRVVDCWRLVRDLLALGWEVRNAAAALGLGQRKTVRMERLGLLHPKILAAIEDGNVPPDYYLRQIAGASRERQEKALKAKGAAAKSGDRLDISWSVLAAACREDRFFRAVAIFDPEAIPWDSDLFAEPGSREEFYTTDGATFLRLQQAALQAQVEEAQAKRKRLQIADWDEARGQIKVPVGFNRDPFGDVEKPKRTQTVFAALRPTGQIERQVFIDVAAERAAQKGKAERQAKAADAGDDADLEWPDEGLPEEPPPAAPPEKPGITKAGLAAIAAAKTDALRETLHTGISEIEPERLLALMLLAFGARNVSVAGVSDMDADGHYVPGMRHFADIADALLAPGGALDSVSMATMRSLCATLLARVLVIKSETTTYAPSTGPPAEWIGAAIGADQALPRFDTAEFLQHVGGDELRDAATAAGEKATGSVKSLREKLVGKMPGYRPAAATFGAPAPVLKGRE